MRIDQALALACLSVACTTSAPRPLPARPTATPPPVPSASSVRAAPPPAATATAPTAPKARPAAPLVTALLVDTLRQWEPALGEELSRLDLGAPGDVDPERSYLYLEHRLRQELTIPALRRSAEPTLQKLASELVRIPSFEQDPIAHANLKMGPLELHACAGCDSDEPRCNPARCERERALLRPALLSAAGLDSDLSFEGHPIATDDGVTTTDSVALGTYLQAVEAAGTARSSLRATVSAIAHDLIRRSSLIERPQPVPREPDEPLARAVLRAGFERWRATYAENLAAAPKSALSAESLDLALVDAYLTIQPSLFDRFGWPKIVREVAGRRRALVDHARATRALRAGKEPGEYAMIVSVEEPCVPGPASASRQCAEAERADALFSGFLLGLSELEEKPDQAGPAATDLALAFECLTLSGLSSARVSELYGKWMSRAAKR